MRISKLGAEAVQTERGGVVTVSFPRLGDPKLLRQAVSTRQGGVSRGIYDSLNVSLKVGDEEVCVLENRSLLGRAAGMNLQRAACVNQVHGDNILRVEGASAPKADGTMGEADGLITNVPGIPLAIFVADCLPVLFYDPVHRAIGLAHAGWRGTVSQVAAKTILRMGEAFGSRPEETRVALGPAIGPCCYEVGEDVREEFLRMFPWGGEVFQHSLRGKWKLDLAFANARQLSEIGVPEENIIRSGICNLEHPGLFYSHRAEASPGRSAGRMGAFLMLAG